MLELTTGEVFQGISYRPFKGLNHIPEQPSFQAPVKVAEAAVYPGFFNRRIRWEKGSEHVAEGEVSKAVERAYAAAKPEFRPVIDALKAQMKHPLAPRELVALVRCERIGKAGEKVVIEDGTGQRIECVDRRKDYSNCANLMRAAAMMAADKPAVLVRLFVRPTNNTIVAVPLAALTAKHHLRLGL